MNSFEIKQEITDLLCQANPDINISESSMDIFAFETNVMPRDMVFACIELKKKYNIDYNKIVDQVSVYSLDNLSEAICSQCK